jgi:hypothetical protein
MGGVGVSPIYDTVRMLINVPPPSAKTAKTYLYVSKLLIYAEITGKVLAEKLLPKPLSKPPREVFRETMR